MSEWGSRLLDHIGSFEQQMAYLEKTHHTNQRAESHSGTIVQY